MTYKVSPHVIPYVALKGDGPECLVCMKNSLPHKRIGSYDMCLLLSTHLKRWMIGQDRGIGLSLYDI